tara:strand:+ start:278 stop:478 length:201 start_codon:yes stop_codon:yes gene_type:complete
VETDSAEVRCNLGRYEAGIYRDGLATARPTFLDEPCDVLIEKVSDYVTGRAEPSVIEHVVELKCVP